MHGFTNSPADTGYTALMPRSRNGKPPDQIRVTPSPERTLFKQLNEARRDAGPDDNLTRYRASHRSGQSDQARQENPAYSAQDYKLGMPYTDKFSVRGMIGQGGTSRVLLGFDKLIGREVAIKELLDIETAAATEDSVSTDMTERFEREIEITGQLEHPGDCTGVRGRFPR